MISRTLQVFVQFFVLGLTSFGGPVAHLGYFHERFVQRLLDVDGLQKTLQGLCQWRVDSVFLRR